MKKLLPALAMLIVSAMVMSSATFAWFTMSKTVVVDPIQLTVNAPASLEISKDAANWGFTVNNNGNALTAIYPTGSENLGPASSNDGLNFAAYVGKKEGTVGSGEEVGTGVILNTGTIVDNEEGVPYAVKNGVYEHATIKYAAYVDYKVYLRVAGGDTNQAMTLKYYVKVGGTDNGSNVYKAVRVALLKGSTETNNTTTATADLVSGGATNGKYITEAITAPTNILTATSKGQEDPSYTFSVAAKSTTHIGGACGTTFPSSTSAETDATDNGNITVGGTNNAIVPVIIRIWVEGQSNACVFQAGKQLTFSVSIQFTEGEATNKYTAQT